MKAPRNQGIEALRILAAFGIVAFHSSAPYQEISYAGLVCFLILVPFVDLKYGGDRVRTIGRLFLALIVPWLFWVGVYGAINLLQHRPFFIDSVLVGSSGHLWFLPFAFLVLVALNLAKRWLPPAVLLWSGAVAAIALLVSAPLWRAASTMWVPPQGQWVHACAPIAVGIVLGLADRVRYGRIAILAVLAATLLAPASDARLTYVVGILVTSLVVLLGDRWRWNVQPVASCMLGLYLVHSLWIMVLTPFVGFGTYLTAILVFAASLASVWVARRFVPPSKWVLG